MAEIILSEHGRKQTPKIADSRRKRLSRLAEKTDNDAARRPARAGEAKNNAHRKSSCYSKYGV
jgi:hypothetical protein